jgi:hypothetical protein
LVQEQEQWELGLELEQEWGLVQEQEQWELGLEQEQWEA